MVVEKFHGNLPRTAKELKEIKGIGQYTAGAIASIAFGEVTPLVGTCLYCHVDCHYYHC